ncbi:MAG: hypothetical protein C0501_29480 [Isosphaera sp.]|nr:hypothetical protein [Isosphaera sp.]
MPVRLSCPSCNTAFTLPAAPAGGRAACPRCGDAFPVRTVTEVADADPTPPPASPSRLPRWSVGRTVAVAAAMGLLGLAAGLWAYHGRGAKPADEKDPRPEDGAVAAARLAGLRHLPADTNVAFAVRPGPILDHAARTKQDPRELLTKVGVPGQLLDAVAGLGLNLADVDHLAGGTHLGDGPLEFRLTLAAVLRRPPDDEDAFLKKVRGTKDSVLPLAVRRVSPTVWVFGLDEKKDLAAGEGALPAGLAGMVGRVPPGAAAWVATDDGRWADRNGVKFVAGQVLKRPGWLPVIARGRAGMAAVTLGDDPRLWVFVAAADAETGRRARDYFTGVAAGDGKARVGGAGELASYDAPVDPADAFPALQRLIGDAGKK